MSGPHGISDSTGGAVLFVGPTSRAEDLTAAFAESDWDADAATPEAVFEERRVPLSRYDCVVAVDPDVATLVRRLRERRDDVPIVAVSPGGGESSSTGGPDPLKSALDAGADAFHRFDEPPSTLPLRVSALVDDANAMPDEDRGEGAAWTEAFGPDDSRCEHYRALVEDVLYDSNVATLVLDETFEVVWASAAFERYFGVDTDALVGRDKRALLREELGDVVAEPDDFTERLLDCYEANGYVSSFVCRVDPGPKYESRWLQHWGLPVTSGPLAGGRIEQYVDVTAREERKEELDRVETIVETLRDSVWTVDTDERLTYVNEALCESLGFDREDLVGASFEEVRERLAPEDDAPSDDLTSAVRDVLHGERELVRAELVMDPDEERRVVDVKVVPLESDGEVVGAVGVNRDVTEREEREAELEASRERYHGLINTAPNPIFVANADTGVIVEVNRAGEELRGEPREDIVGRHQEELHPPEDRSQARKLFEKHVSSGGRFRELPDGDQVYAVTADGTSIPVEISAETVKVGNETLIHGIFRDITEQRRHEQLRTMLNETAGDLLQAETAQQVSRYLVEVAQDVFDLSHAVVYRFDEESGELVPTAWSESLDRGDVAVRPLQPGESRVWDVFVTDETVVSDDGEIRVVDGPVDPETELAVPIQDHGVFVAADVDGTVFDSTVVDLVEILAANAKAALDRADREEHLRSRDRKLARQNERLDRLQETVSRLLSVYGAVLEANTREEIERAVCEQLVATGEFEFAFVGQSDRVDEQLDVRSVGGNPRGYLESVALELDGDEGVEPSVQAAQREAVVTVENTASDLRDSAWQKEALSRNVRSVMSVPLSYQDVNYGVLSVYSSHSESFDEMLRRALAELGRGIAYAINSVERTDALLTDRVVELEFQVSESTCFFVRFAREAEVSLRFERVVPEGESTYRVFVRVDTSDTDSILDAASDSNIVDGGGTVVNEFEDESVVQLRLSEGFLPVALAEYGLRVDGIDADPDDARIVVEVPPTIAVHDAVDVVTALYPDAELVSKRQGQSRIRTTNLVDRVVDELTDRQLEAAQLAFDSGFFDTPREATGADVADAMDISSSAFHRHLRAAERSLFGVVFDRHTPNLSDE